jgi:HK97 family phage major capsid protein
MSTKLSTRERLEKAVADVEQFSDELDAKTGDLSAEDLQNLKNRLEEIKDLKGQVEAEAEAKGTMDDAKAFLAQLGAAKSDEEKQSSFPTYTAEGLPMQTNGKTFGELFVESPAYEDFLSRYGNKGVIPNSVKGIQSQGFQVDSKALVTGGSATSAGAAVRNDFYAPITDLIGERELTVRDLVTVGQTSSDTVEYVRVTGKTNAAAPTAEATSAAFATQDGTTGALIPAVGGGYKPESAMTLEVVSTTVKTIAHWIPMTKRAASDAPQVRTLIDNFLRYGLNEELEDQILNGSGAGENFTGIMNASPLTVGSAGTDLDAIVDAIRTIRVTGRRRPTGLVIHPNDWYSTGFLLSKDSAGNYLVGDPRASIDQLNQLWGLSVVVTEAQTENTALVGDFRQAVLWEREGVNVLVSDQHQDFFTRNLLAILGEMRAAFGVLDDDAFCTVTAV